MKKTIATRIADLLPFCSKRRLREEQRRADMYWGDLQRVKANIKESVEEERAKLKSILKELVRLRWEESPSFNGRYVLTMTFDPRAVGYGSFDRFAMEELAEMMAHHVHSEILTAKFMHPPDPVPPSRFQPGLKEIP